MTVSLANAMGPVCSIVVSSVLWRAIGPEEFGVAASLWLLVSMLSMVSDLGVDRMIVQAADGGDRRMAGVAQSLLLIRGMVLASVVFALSDVCAELFGDPDNSWAFRIVALQPLIESLKNTDYIRQQRTMQFRSTAIVASVPQLCAAALAYPVALGFGDFRAAVALAFVRPVVMVLMSHLTAERRYHLAWDGEAARRYWRFGAPLLLNGLFIYSGIQGSQPIVRHFYGPEGFAVFNLAMMLTWIPVGQIDGVVQTIGLPLLAGGKADGASFSRRVVRIGQWLGYVAAFFAWSYALVAPTLVRTIYGSDTERVIELMGVFSILYAIALLRLGPTLVALSLGDARPTMLGNAGRIASLGVSVVLAQRGAPLEAICWGMVAIDAAVYPILVAALQRAEGTSISGFASGAAFFACVAGLLMAGLHLQSSAPTVSVACLMAATICIAAPAVWAAYHRFQVRPHCTAAAA